MFISPRLFFVLRQLALVLFSLAAAATTTQAVSGVLTNIAIQGPASIDEATSSTYAIVASYGDGSSRTLTTKISSGFFGGTDYSIYFLNSLASSVSSSLSATNLSSTMTFAISASMSDGSSVSANGYFSVSGEFASSPGGTVVSAANVLQDQTITLSASYTENGITKLATLPVTVTHIIPPVTTSTTTLGPTTTTTNTTTTTTLPSINLTTGWNLVGNGSDAPINVATTFSDTNSFTTVWKWIAAQSAWGFHAPSLAAQGGTALADYVASKGYQLLATIAGGEGFWVNAKQASSINLPSGNAISVTTLGPTLIKGWNLVSVGETATPKQFCDAQSGGVTTLWSWEATNSAWYFYAPSLDANMTLSSYIASKGYLDFTANNKALGPGMGFWVNKP